MNNKIKEKFDNHLLKAYTKTIVQSRRVRRVIMSETGQGTLEWVAICAIVLALGAAVASYMSGEGETVGGPLAKKIAAWIENF